MSEKLSSKLGNEEKPVNKTGLPLDYGDTKITILPRDPICIFAYWSISGEFLDKLKKQYGEQNFENSKLVVRVYDTTDINFDGNNANRYFDVFVTPESSSWYINVGEFNRCWCADIGYLTKDGKFIREWSHAREAAEALGLNKRAIYECCVGRSRTSGGYIWKRKENMK